MTSLRKSTISGLVWTFGETFFLNGLTFVASIILARILGPVEFGLIGMVSIFIAIGVGLVDSGLSSSLIRNKFVNDTDLNTVFYFNLAISIIIYFIFYLIAPWIASFYQQDLLVPIIRLYCLTFVISSFSVVQIAMLIRKMEFKKLMKYNIPGTILGVIVGISLGLSGYGVWSIIWMYLTSKSIQTIILWFNTEWKPKLVFSSKKLKIHYNFGFKLMISGLINNIFSNLYKVVIGKFYTVQTLGYFERAYAFNMYPVTSLTGIIEKVTYPMLSKIQDDTKRISLIYKKLIIVTFFISAPLMFGLAAIAEPLFQIILGDNWMPAVPFFQILCFASLFYPINAFNLNILKVFGRSDLFLKIEVYKKIIIIICLFVGFQFGIYGILWSLFFSSLIGLLINMLYSKNFINYKILNQVVDILPTFLISMLMFVLIFISTILLESLSKIMILTLGVIIGVIVYMAFNFIFKTKSLKYFLEITKLR